MSAPSFLEFTATETLYQDGRTTLYRGFRGSDPHPVILKVLDPHRCRQKDLDRLRHEYETGASLDVSSIARPLALETYRGMPALVLEDFGGEPLERFLDGPMPLGRFLDLAVHIAGAVADLHRGGVVHKDLKPSNILVQPGADEVKLVDFGIATRAPREQQDPRPPPLIEGSLPYMSPEQTGHMNRALDSRSDLYSLGVTFYQMLTGRLPFEASDPLEWIHCHVARAPPSPAQLVPEVPEAVARIVMKLLAKMAEDRYQTARGLKHDLERCREQWRERHRVDAFPLAERDVPDRLQIPQRLFGRERQVAEMLRAFERVADTGAPELVLVSGYAGIGKSSLVHELEKPILERRGLFAAGKFDQYRRDVPYSTIVQALRELVLDLLVEGEDRVAAWRQRLQAALSVNARLVVDLIPQVELLIGPQPPVPELPLSEAKTRFHAVFRRFLRVFADEDHPLTMFLDDLQWADPASLELLADVLTSGETRHLLAVGAYRDNEVTPAHPLAIALAGLRRSGLAVRDVVVGPLSHRNLGRLVADTMRRSPHDVEPLTRLVREKTGGNPFFAIQFLTSLQDEGLIRLDPRELVWRCDVEAARSRGYTDNVVDLMISKLKRLPSEAQEAASLAACVGNAVDAGRLAVLRERSEEDTHRDLWALVREGLLHRSGDTYRFTHDRVQQAAYALIPEGQRSATHLQIGRLLRAHTPAAQVSERVFEIVNQLNRGARLIERREERYEVAELDLLAGQRAKAASAYRGAAEYLAAGGELLPDTAWEERHELAFALHLERARCEYVTGGFDEAERDVALALRKARTRAETAACHLLRIEVYAINGEVEKAIDCVLECAALFGVRFERHPPAESVRERYDAIMRLLGPRSIAQLVELAPMSDRDVRTFVEALVAAIPIAYQHDLTLPFAFTSEVVRLSIEHGDAPCSAHAYALFGMLVGPYLGQYREAYEFGKLAYDLVARRGQLENRAGSAVCFGAYTLFWTRHVRDALAYLEEGLRAGAETGDLRNACYCGFSLVSTLLARGDPLDEVERRSAEMLAFARNARFAYAEDMILIQRRLVHRLRGRPSSGSSASATPEDEGLDTRILHRVPLTVCDYHVRRLQERFLFGEHLEALAAAAQAKDLLWTSMASWERCEHSYFFALALAATFPEEPSRERDESLQALRAEVDRHSVWAENAPENFRNRHALVAAELARVEGRELDAERLYEAAIRSAADDGFVQNEALAYELASRFHRTQGRHLIADTYLREARTCYLRWGAEGKVSQLDELHPGLLDVRPTSPAVTFVAPSEHLDLLAVAKASQTISSEMEMEKLVGTLLQVVLEHGGARKGYLLLAREGEIDVEAEASLDGNAVATRLLPSSPLDPAPSAGALLPVSIVQYARVTREPVLLEDVSRGAGKLASDPYFTRHRTRSVLCLPIVRHELVGLLYLENDLVAGAFTPHRLTALSLLASQAAISLENTRLLSEERKARRRSSFLAEAAALLAESLDVEETLTRLGRLCVRSLADWCVLDLLEGREIRRLSGACADASREPLLEHLRQHHPARWGSPHAATRCLRDGVPIWMPAVSDEQLRGLCEDEDHLRVVRTLGAGSLLAVPLPARRQVLGVLSLFSSTPGRYGRDDLELAQEVAHRAAIALDNARLYRETQRAVHMRDEFLQVASHELRTPLTSLTLSLDNLVRVWRSGRDVGPEMVARQMELAARQGNRLTRLVDDLLEVSRADLGGLALELADVDLCEVARAVAERFGAELARSGCTLAIRCDRSVVGRWDASRIDQVVTNLVSNALKFGAGNAIEIDVSEHEGTARLSVRDHGIGIDTARQREIFDRFQRAVPTKHYGGLGLGLYISRGIVEAHGGTIRVDSAPGAGATFTIELPCARR